MANTDNTNSNPGVEGMNHEHENAARTMRDIQAGIKSGPGASGKPGVIPTPKPASAQRHRATLPARKGK